jgi:ribonuclease R
VANRVDAAAILRALRTADHPLGVAELLRLTGGHRAQTTELKRTLNGLLRQRQVTHQGKRYAIAGRQATPEETGKGKASSGGGTLEGTLSVHRDGFGFVDVGTETDVFVPPHEARRALDGDRVRVRLVTTRGRPEGHIVDVLSRQRERLVGTYVDRGMAEALVRPLDPNLPGPVRVPRTQLARDGDVVTVRLGVGAELLGGGLVGEVTGSLGRPGHPSQDVLNIVYAQGFSEAFPAQVMDEADRVPLQVLDSERAGRRDLRALSLVTIDGADARDFDDAVLAEELPHGGTRLWVAIADVSHYVRPGSALDAEALHRGTSVYLPDRVLPMLPERLSNGICSLRPEEDRLCLVAEMTFDAGAHRTSTELYPAVMRSAARCTYDEVQAVLDGVSVPNRDRFRPLFERLQRLGRKLRQVREERGAIDFDLPETRPELDEEGNPVRMVRRERKESHRIVEDCMLAANEAVAAYFQDSGLPSVYRFHGEPDPEKLAAFAQLARAHGFTVPGKGEPTSRELNLFMAGLVGHPGQRALNQLLLRSMMQAVYSPDQVGHYGLGAEEYLHFTSPIRRYPDLLVHRLLRSHWERKGHRRSARELQTELETLRAMAQLSSNRERAAMKAEREVNALYAALLMEDRVGEEFAGIASSLTDFGFFVELDKEHVEGLVPAADLGPGHRLEVGALVWPNGRRVQVGQAVTVRLASVNVARRQLEFDVIAFAGERPSRRRGGAERAEEPSRAHPAAVSRGVGRQGRGERASHSQRGAGDRSVSGGQAPSSASPHPGFDRLREQARSGSRRPQHPKKLGHTGERPAAADRPQHRSASPDAPGGRHQAGKGPVPVGRKGGGDRRGSPGGNSGPAGDRGRRRRRPRR